MDACRVASVAVPLPQFEALDSRHRAADVTHDAADAAHDASADLILASRDKGETLTHSAPTRLSKSCKFLQFRSLGSLFFAIIQEGLRVSNQPLPPRAGHDDPPQSGVFWDRSQRHQDQQANKQQGNGLVRRPTAESTAPILVST